jgi:hypothetical protein
MTLLFAAAALFAFLVWRGRVGRVLKGAEWRASAAILSVGLFAAAGFEALRGGVVVAVLLGIAGLVLVGTARWPRAAVRVPVVNSMSESEARATLGVGPGATVAEIKAAYARLIRMAHPDAGGTAGLAAQLNAARDRLLRG